MQNTINMHNLLNEPSVNSEYLLDSNSFANLISPKGEMDNIFFNNLISEWQKNEQTNSYINLDDSDNPKIKIDKLIADGKLAQYTIENINVQVLSENAEQIFDFGNGISINTNLSLALDNNSIKDLDGFAKSCNQGGKLCFNKNDDASVAVCVCKTAKDSVNNINEILQSCPEFANGLWSVPIRSYTENSVKNVKQLQELMSRLLVDLSPIDYKIQSLIQSNIDVFDKDAFKDFIDKGFEFQTMKNDDGKTEKQFFFTDINCALETNFFNLYGLALKAKNFGKNSIHDVKVFYLISHEGIVIPLEVCQDLIKHNPEAFAAGAFKEIDLSDNNIRAFLCLSQGIDKQSVIKYKILGYFLYVFLIGFLFDLSKGILEKAKRNEEYNQYLDQLKKLIERDNTKNPQKPQEIVIQTIEQKISRVENCNTDSPATTPLVNVNKMI